MGPSDERRPTSARPIRAVRRAAASAAATLAALALVAGGAVTLPASPVRAAPAEEEKAVVERVKVGESVRGRTIWAYRIGEPADDPRRHVPTVVLLSAMHGDEPRSRPPLLALKDGRPVVGAEIWLVPTYNPDGLAAGTRKNARGVDLNRNFPYRWADLDGRYESGPRPGSEPETRAVMRFLAKVRPDRILSFHQPLQGVDTDTKDAAFAKRVARTLGLPEKTFDCGGTCHGTMTGWYNDRFAGSALTVEFGPRPSVRWLRTTVARRVLAVFGATYGSFEWGPQPGEAEEE